MWPDGKEKAGLQWSLWQTRDGIRSFWANRIGRGAPVYLAGCLEYITAELLELSGNAARDNDSAVILPIHITLAIKCDVELHKLFRTATFAGVVPSARDTDEEEEPASAACGQNYCTREEGLELDPGHLPAEVVQKLLKSNTTVTLPITITHGENARIDEVPCLATPSFRC